MKPKAPTVTNRLRRMASARDARATGEYMEMMLAQIPDTVSASVLYISRDAESNGTRKRSYKPCQHK